MNCFEVQDYLSAWLDDELPDEVHRQVAAHLEACPACRSELALLTRLDEALGALEAPLPTSIGDRVLARLRPTRLRPWWQDLALAASLLLGLVLGGTLARDYYPYGPANGSGGEILALEDFHDFPQGSWGGALVSYQADEGNGV